MPGAILENFWYKKARFLVQTLLNLELNRPEPELMVQFKVQLISWTEPKVRF